MTAPPEMSSGSGDPELQGWVALSRAPSVGQDRPILTVGLRCPVYREWNR